MNNTQEMCNDKLKMKTETKMKNNHLNAIAGTNPTNKAAEDISHEYDGFVHMTAITDPKGLKTLYNYDQDGNTFGIESPDTGIISYANSESGSQLCRADAEGVTMISWFDEHRRVLSVSFPDPSNDVSFGYNMHGDEAFAPVAMSDPSGNYEYAYDGQGHLGKQKAVILDQEYITRYTRDAAGRVTTMVYPNGSLVEYQHDIRGGVCSVLVDGQVVVKNIVRSTGGLIRSMEHGNGLITSRKYDDKGRLIGNYITDMVKYDLIYNRKGQIAEVIDLLDPSSSQAFDYDDLGRLIKADGPYGSRIYTYDTNGNRLSRISDGGTETYAYITGTNQVCQVNGPNARHIEYSQNGQVIRDGWTVMAYNQARRLASAKKGDGSTAHYTYNGIGQRVIKSHNGSSTVYHYDVEGRLIAESNQKGELQQEYIWLDDELIAVLAGSELYFTHRDYRNQPTVVTNGNSNVAWKTVSTPFGNSAENYPEVAEKYRNFSLNLRLPGQYFDVETGYHYNYMRDYSPELGRYLQADPIGLNGGMNLYGYCGGDPVNKADPTGLADPGADIGDGQIDETESIDGDWDNEADLDAFLDEISLKPAITLRFSVPPLGWQWTKKGKNWTNQPVASLEAGPTVTPGLYDPISGKTYQAPTLGATPTAGMAAPLDETIKDFGGAIDSTLDWGR